jgi:hypothetical protein
MLKKAINDALKWSSKWFFGSVSSSFAIFMICKSAFDFTILRSIKYGVALLILVLLIKIIIQYITEIEKLNIAVTEKDDKIDLLNTTQKKNDLITKFNYYGEVILLLKDSFNFIHKTRRNPDLSSKELTTVLISTSNKLKHIFEKRLDFEYSVSIKVITNEDNITDEANLKTLCRDESSHYARKNNSTITHNIKENTCFNEIFQNIDNASKSFFISNNLPILKLYKNSSFKQYGTVHEDCNDEDRRKYWTLPYRSEIVVPIATFADNENLNKKDLYGFLCVDCKEENAFHKKYDVGMLQGVADGLSDLLKLWKSNNNSNQNQNV